MCLRTERVGSYIFFWDWQYTKSDPYPSNTFNMCNKACERSLALYCKVEHEIPLAGFGLTLYVLCVLNVIMILTSTSQLMYCVGVKNNSYGGNGGSISSVTYLRLVRRSPLRIMPTGIVYYHC